MKNLNVNINGPDGKTTSYSIDLSDAPDDCSLDSNDLDERFEEHKPKIKVPDGWHVSNAGVIGPEITKQQHLSGNQDKSKMPAPQPGAGQPQPSTSDVDSSNLSENDRKKYTHTYRDSKTGKEKKKG